MELFMDLLLLLGGVAVFMFGMKTMNQGMETSAGSGVHKLFKKINKNRFIDYGIGIGVTALVQSSSATSIMTVGLANSGVVTVKQGSGIVLGAKVGTTLTAFIFAIGLLSKGGFSVSMLFAAVSFVGVLILFITNKESLKKVATFLTGFGMLFVGLAVMETAIGGKDSVLSTELTKLFQYDILSQWWSPILLVILGTIFTCIIQSSTAATGVFLTFLITGVITHLDQAFFLIMGANIGTCSDGLMASVGTNANGKRIAVFHVLTSTIGAVFFSIIVAVFKTPIVNMFESIFPNNAWSLAVFNLSYNSIYTLALLPCLGLLVKFVTLIVRDKNPKEKKLYYVDNRLLATPAIAIEQSLKEVCNLAILANDNVYRAFNAVTKEDMSQSKKIAESEYEIDYITRALASYFIQISSKTTSVKDEKLIGRLHHVITDIERIGDHAVDLAKETNYMKQLDVKFSDQAKSQLNDVYSKVSELFALCLDTFKTRKTQNLHNISAVHKEVVGLIDFARNEHIRRLNTQKCSFEASKSIYAVLLSLQRVADHLVNIGFSIRSDTGSKTEALASLENSKKKLTVTCTYCKVKNSEDATKCSNCGSVLE